MTLFVLALLTAVATRFAFAGMSGPEWSTELLVTIAVASVLEAAPIGLLQLIARYFSSRCGAPSRAVGRCCQCAAVLLFMAGLVFSVFDCWHYRELGSRIRPAVYEIAHLELGIFIIGTHYRFYLWISLAVLAVGALLTCYAVRWEPACPRKAAVVLVLGPTTLALVNARWLGDAAGWSVLLPRSALLHSAVRSSWYRSALITWQATLSPVHRLGTSTASALAESSPPTPQADEQRWLQQFCLKGMPDTSPASPLSTQPEAPLFRRIVVVAMESVGISRLHRYHPEIPAEATPYLDELSAAFPHLDNFYVSMMPTFPALVALHLSQLDIQGPVILAPETPTLFTELANHGFTTVFISGVMRRYGEEAALFQRMLKPHILLTGDEVGKTLGWPWGATDRDVYARAVKILVEHRTGPVFIHIQTIDTHDPFYLEVPRERLPAALRAADRLQQALFGADMNLRLFLQDLERRDLIDNETLVVVTGDHNEPGWGLVPDRVPLIFITPALDKLPPFVSSRFSSQIDFAPTLLDLLGFEVPAHFLGVPLSRKGCEPLALSHQGDQLIVHGANLTFALPFPQRQQAPPSGVTDLAARSLRAWYLREPQ